MDFMSHQEPICGTRARHDANISSAEYSVAIARNPSVHRIPHEAWDECDQRGGESPAPAEASQHSNDRVGIGIAAPLLEQKKRFGIIRVDTVLDQQLTADGRLHGCKLVQLVSIMP
jgi:hypothetical protein